MLLPSSYRRALVPEGVDGVVHAGSRCERRAWLCGVDAHTGQCHGHRRERVRERVRGLLGVLAVEVCAHAIVSNHRHSVLWCRASVAAGWLDEEVA